MKRKSAGDFPQFEEACNAGMKVMGGKLKINTAEIPTPKNDTAHINSMEPYGANSPSETRRHFPGIYSIEPKPNQLLNTDHSKLSVWGRY